MDIRGALRTALMKVVAAERKNGAELPVSIAFDTTGETEDKIWMECDIDPGSDEGLESLFRDVATEIQRELGQNGMTFGLEFGEVEISF